MCEKEIDSSFYFFVIFFRLMFSCWMRISGPSVEITREGRKFISSFSASSCLRVEFLTGLLAWLSMRSFVQMQFYDASNQLRDKLIDFIFLFCSNCEHYKIFAVKLTDNCGSKVNNISKRKVYISSPYTCCERKHQVRENSIVTLKGILQRRRPQVPMCWTTQK